MVLKEVRAVMVFVRVPVPAALADVKTRVSPAPGTAFPPVQFPEAQSVPAVPVQVSVAVAAWAFPASARARAGRTRSGFRHVGKVREERPGRRRAAGMGTFN